MKMPGCWAARPGTRGFSRMCRICCALPREILSAAIPAMAVSSTRRRLKFLPQRQGPPGSSRALGWDTPSQPSSSGRYFSPASIGHLGYSGCSLWIDLEAGIAVALLTNRTWPDRQSQLIRTGEAGLPRRCSRWRCKKSGLPAFLRPASLLRILFGVDCFPVTIKTRGLTRC